MERPLSAFYIDLENRKNAKSGREDRMWCRYCQREWAVERRRPRVEYADRIKMEHGCADCGIRSDHPEIYDFDHLDPTTKSKSVAALLTSGSFDAFVAEIAKCQVVCANCHRIRTRSREHSSFGRSRSIA